MSLKERRSVSSTGGSTPRQEKMVVERSNSSANVDSSVSIISEKSSYCLGIIDTFAILLVACNISIIML